ncbi:MAG: MBL fold metallo-hydrolase, partial [Leptospiraceae bacterium]|nr:MBL fold metallo-hydrolase [Leptospiraceae bacterium]
MFDIGNLPLDFNHIENLFVTHGHLDHANGIPYFISQRSLKNLKAPNIYVPEEMYEHQNEILKLYQKIENFEYKFNLFPAKIGEFYNFGKNNYIKPLKTHHRIPSQGYTLFEKIHKLKKEFAGLDKNEIIQMKSKGEILTEDKMIPQV